MLIEAAVEAVDVVSGGGGDGGGGGVLTFVFVGWLLAEVGWGE